MRGMPLTSSGAICVPTSDRHGRFAAAADWYTQSDLPTPGPDRSRMLCRCAIERKICFACPSVTVSIHVFCVMMLHPRFFSDGSHNRMADGCEKTTRREGIDAK